MTINELQALLTNLQVQGKGDYTVQLVQTSHYGPFKLTEAHIWEDGKALQLYDDAE